MENEQRRQFEDAVKNANLPEFDFDKAYDRLQEAARNNTQHTPRQQGPYIVCTSCPHQHTLSWIGPLKSFKGVDEKGGYILEDRF